MEHRKPGDAQTGKYLLQVGADQDRLRRNQMLAGKAANCAAVATTSGRQGGQCWKSDTGWSLRLGWSM